MLRSGGAVPLVCRPGAIPAGERVAHFALAYDLFRRLGEPGEVIADGYVFRFPAGAYERVARFVGNERRCCPALRFELCVAENDGGVELRMSGPPGAREFIAAELPLRGGCACGDAACT